ncbi:hypothetical protein [Ruegeria meonggei]|uniref:hypothetical protein n=1 Tax=Ruegeria meonggei TaxID=1446476 RepID=UPI00366D282A
MKEGFTPLIFGLVMVSFAAIFWQIDARQSHETELLASEVELFLEDHRAESSSHYTVYQKARQLHNLTQSPNRILLVILSLIIAVQFFSAFVRNSKGQVIAQKFTEMWTWRP